VWELPVVYVCENNQYGMSMSQDRSTAGGSVAGRASAYGMPGAPADGNDVEAVYEASVEAVERARSGGGPTLVEAITYRYRGHSKSDRNLYRTQEEIEDWRTNRDPIERFVGKCREERRLSPDEIDACEASARETIRKAVSEAFAAPNADPADLEGAAYA